MGAEQSVSYVPPPSVVHEHHYHPPARNELHVHTNSLTYIRPSRSSITEIRSTPSRSSITEIRTTASRSSITEIRTTPSISSSSITAIRTTSSRPSARITEIKNTPNQKYKSITPKPSLPAVKANTEKRGFGEYKCSTCNRTWKSKCSWADAGQKCNKCNTNVRPHKLTPISVHQEDKCEKCKKLGHPCYRNK